MIGKGYVTLVSGKDFRGTMLYSFRVGTEDKFFRTGSTNSQLNKNDYIEFSYIEKNGSYNVDVGSIKHIAREESSSGSSGAQATGSVQRDLTKDDYWRRREDADVAKYKESQANSLRIQYQSARNAAISVVDVLIRDKILKLSDAAKADNVSVVLGKIDDLTNEFFEKCGAIGRDSDRGVPGATGGSEDLGADSGSAWQ